jgi:hypothetical protein
VQVVESPFALGEPVGQLGGRPVALEGLVVRVHAGVDDRDDRALVGAGRVERLGRGRRRRGAEVDLEASLAGGDALDDERAGPLVAGEDQVVLHHAARRTQLVDEPVGLTVWVLERRVQPGPGFVHPEEHVRVHPAGRPAERGGQGHVLRRGGRGLRGAPGDAGAVDTLERRLGGLLLELLALGADAPGGQREPGQRRDEGPAHTPGTPRAFISVRARACTTPRPGASFES